MNLRPIKTFKAIVKHGSFRLAAEELMYAQSTVTSQIKKLENELGVKLLERGKKIQLTEPGKLLYEKGDFLLQMVENLQRALGELSEDTAKVLKVGVMEPVASYRFPAVVKNMLKQFPDLQLSLHIHESPVLTELVAKGEIDFALCVAPDRIDHTVFEPLFSEKVVLLIPTGHHLAEKEVIYVKDLKDEKLLITNSDCPFRESLEKKFIRTGIIPSNKIEISNMLTLIPYVQFGFGMAVVPLITVSSPPERTVIKPIADFQEGVQVGILRKVDLRSGETVKSLLDIVYREL